MHFNARKRWQLSVQKFNVPRQLSVQNCSSRCLCVFLVFLFQYSISESKIDNFCTSKTKLQVSQIRSPASERWPGKCHSWYICAICVLGKVNFGAFNTCHVSQLLPILIFIRRQKKLCRLRQHSREKLHSKAIATPSHQPRKRRPLARIAAESPKYSTWR